MIKDKIIISILNKLGIGVNAYVPKNTAMMVNMLKKLLPDMEITYIEEKNEDNHIFHVTIDNEIGIDYKIDGSRVSEISIC